MEREEKQICSMCELPPENGKLINVDWIGAPVCLECYLELRGTKPEAKVDYCSQCGCDQEVKYYPLVKQSLCQHCAEGIPSTTSS